MMKFNYTHSLSFGSSNVEGEDLIDFFTQRIIFFFSYKFEIEILPTTSSNHPTDLYSSSQGLPTQEQLLRSQYDNEPCDLMSLIKVHEYLTKQQHPSSIITTIE